MKKFVYIPNFLAIVAGLLRGESFEGRLYIDRETHVLTLKLWNRMAPKSPKYRKTGDTDYGRRPATRTTVACGSRTDTCCGVRSCL